MTQESQASSQADTHTDSSVMRMLPANLVERTSAGTRCLACARRCFLHDEQYGFCTAILNRDRQLYSTAYGVVGEAGKSPIESKPIFHFRPGTMVLSLGGLGCNLRCAFCQNWELAFRNASQGGGLSA